MKREFTGEETKPEERKAIRCAAKSLLTGSAVVPPSTLAASLVSSS